MELNIGQIQTKRRRGRERMAQSNRCRDRPGYAEDMKGKHEKAESKN